ncbi:MAG: flavodoxin domain-containing protein [Planctomycetota bacterium]
MRTLVLYASDYGHTATVAEAVAEGARGVGGAHVDVARVADVEAQQLLAADAVLLGSPVHMGSVHWEVQRFFDQVCASLWMRDEMVGRVAGLFATGGGLGGAGGGCELTLLSMLANFAELGMVFVPLPKSTPGYADGGLHWGPYVRCATADNRQATPQKKQLVAARCHGAHVTHVAQRLRRLDPLFAH